MFWEIVHDLHKADENEVSEFCMRVYMCVLLVCLFCCSLLYVCLL